VGVSSVNIMYCSACCAVVWIGLGGMVLGAGAKGFLGGEGSKGGDSGLWHGRRQSCQSQGFPGHRGGWVYYACRCAFVSSGIVEGV
jgi:hypothetical protein